MLLDMSKHALWWVFSLCSHVLSYSASPESWHGGPAIDATENSGTKHAFIDSILANMTVGDLVLQLHLMFADDIVGKDSRNRLYDDTMHLSLTSPIGVIHDWYPMNKSYYNALQQLQLEKSDLKIPMMLVEECLHGVGSFKQSMFPQNIGLAATWDTDVVYRIGRAIGTEARSIGVHGCFSPVLDLGQDPRWGRMQEAFGEDKILTSHIGVAYSSGMSKNGSWSEPDAVFPIMKHFAAHGAAQAGHNAAPFIGLGERQIRQDLLVPFKAVYDLGGARGVMMAYNEIDGIPAAVHPMLYRALEDWSFDGFTLADDTCMRNLVTKHNVADSQADAMQQWFNAGGMIDFYDWDLDSYLTTTKELVANGSVSINTLKSHVRKILNLKWDLGLFTDPFIAEEIDPTSITASHQDIALEAAHKSIVLLENKNMTLPLDVMSNQKIALIGPFADTLNFGDYSGVLGQYPAKYASTIRQGLLQSVREATRSKAQIRSSWGTNSWEYNNQYVIPSYLLSVNGTAGGLQATYFSNTNFTGTTVSRIETPAQDWGLYPPPGLPSNNFSAIWEGQLESPVDAYLSGWIGLAISANSSAKLFVDNRLTMSKDYSEESNLLGNIQDYDWVRENSTLPPKDGSKFQFQVGRRYNVRIAFQSFNNYKKVPNVSSVNSQLVLWWNLVSPNGEALDQAISIARDSDIIILAVGAAWNSDGESGDRATLGLAPSQEKLANSMFELGKPVVMLLQGGRPFAIPHHYNNSAAVLSTFFGGQTAGLAIADILFGKFSPGGRLPVSVPYHVGQVPVYYNHKPTAREVQYLDMPTEPSATSKSLGTKHNSTEASCQTFGKGDYITFTAAVHNVGPMEGSYVAQVYLLGRVSAITQPVRQLVAFQRVYLQSGERKMVSMDLEVDRYLRILNRKGEWELEGGDYTFALQNDAGEKANANMNVTMKCKGKSNMAEA